MNQPNVPNPIPGMMLAQDENVIADLEVKAALLMPFRSSFIVTDRRFGGNYRRGLFSSEQFQFPLANIASVGVGTGIGKAPLFFGVIAVISGLALLAIWMSADPGEINNAGMFALSGVVITALGGLGIFSAFRAEARVTNNAGQTIRCQVNLFEKARTAEFFSLVSREIAEANYGAS